MKTLIRFLNSGILVASGFTLLTACGSTSSTNTSTTDTSTDDQTTTEESEARSYIIPGTGQSACYDNNGIIECPSVDENFYGQDAQQSQALSYVDNGDGTITDLITGLMWEKGFNESLFNDAQSAAANSTTANYTDWRVPTIKELYSLIHFDGNQGTGNPSSATPPSDAVPFIDTNYFDFEYPSDGRYIDAQYISSTEYVSTTMNGSATFFGVNFADGRIKGYPISGNVSSPEFYLRLVRNSTDNNYGVNALALSSENTIYDSATGLTWMQSDSGAEQFAPTFTATTFDNGSVNWQEALEFCNELELDELTNWRLPTAKELQSILDYTKSPDTSASAAINNIFQSTEILNEAGNTDYPFYWTSTTFLPGSDAVYFAFGRALGYFSVNGEPETFMDVHGAGAQRTDPKTGSSSYGFGPQGDVRRVYNYARCVHP